MLSKNMIFRNTLFGVAVCLAGVLTACAEKELEVVGPADGGEQVEICFAPTVGADISTKGSDIQPLGETGLYLRTIISENKTNPFDEVATRATMVNGFDPDGADGTYPTFTVYSFLHDGTWAENSGNATPYINDINAVSLGNGYWGFEESVFWPAWDTNMTFLSYAAPEDSEVDISFTADDGEGGLVYATPTLEYSDPAVANDESHHGTITDENLAKQYDLLVAETPDVTNGTTTIPMSFSHVFAAVQFLCGDMTGGKITKLSLANIAHKGVYDFGTGTWKTDTGDRTEYVFDFEENPVVVPGLAADEELEEGQNMPSYDFPILSGESTLMMVPQDLTGSVLLIEYTSAVEGSTKVELAVELHGEWEAGAHITYHISFLSGDDDIIPDLSGQDGYFAEYVLANYDEDGDGHVSQDEADKVETLKIGYYSDEGQEPTQRIDFTGIEHFTNLKSFTSNYASAIDLSQNLELNYIVFNSDGTHTPNVSTLDLSKNTKLTKVPDNAFRSNTNLRTVTLPDTVEEIGWAAFEGVTGLASSNGFTSLTLPETVTKIGGEAFSGCSYLATINIPTGLTELGAGAFYNCTKLTSDISIPNVTEIKDSIFCSCSGITSLTLSENITGKIGDCAFYGCSGVTSAIKLPEGITEIGYQAFRNCSSIPSFTLPSTLAAVGDHAFRVSSSNTAEFIIPESFATECPDGVTPRIGQYAFYYRAGLPSFPLPDFITEIGDYAFSYCTQMTTISAIPSKLETLGTYAFRNCTAMTTDIVIPEAIDTIPSYAFYHCDSVTLVDMPSTLKRIDTYAFEYCSSLTAMIVRAEAPTFQDLPSVGSHGVDTQGSTKPVLYVPDNSYDWYNNTSSPFKSYVSSVKKLSDLVTDFPGEYDADGNRLTTTEP